MRPKSQLRRIVKRTWHSPHLFTDTLECGHAVRRITDFEWADGRLVDLAPTAKRRRCPDCKPIAPALRIASISAHRRPVATFRLYEDCEEVRSAA